MSSIASSAAVLGESLHSVKTGEAAMNKAFGQSIFDYLAGAPEDATLLLVEMVIQPGNEFHPGKLLDLIMLPFTPGGQERTEGEYAVLFGKAGLKLRRVVATASPVSVIEAKPV